MADVRRLACVVLALAATACSIENAFDEMDRAAASNRVRHAYYARDGRTGICYAVSGHAMAAVPCSEEVLRLVVE